VTLRGKGSAIHFFLYSNSTDGTQSYTTTGDPEPQKKRFPPRGRRCRCPAGFQAQNSNTEFPFAPNHWLSSLSSSLLPVSVLSVLVASQATPSSPLPRFPFNGAQIYPTRSRLLYGSLSISVSHSLPVIRTHLTVTVSPRT